MSPLTTILVNLYGEEFRQDFTEHFALLREINNYYRRKRSEINEFSKIEFVQLAKSLRNKYKDINCYFNDDVYWSYSQWFKNVFLEDYDKALTEVFLKEQDIPSDRELCILRLAREAAYKYIDIDTIYKFFTAYNIDANERTIFWTEFTYHKLKTFNN